MRGRKPKSIEDKIAAGNPGKRTLKKKEFESIPGNLACPSYLSKEEKSIWKATLKTAPLNVIKPADIELLVTYCQQVSISRQAHREMKQMAEDNRRPDGSTFVMSMETERAPAKLKISSSLPRTMMMASTL